MTPAFGEELVGLLPNLRRYGLSLSRRADIADDLVQITVERALNSYASYDPLQRLEPWLFRIMRNAWIDMTRRDKTAGVQIDVHELPEALPTDPGKSIEARLMLESVDKAMSELPEDQRDVLRLVCIEELSYAEAADVLEIPKGTVMSRLSRGRSAILQKLGIN